MGWSIENGYSHKCVCGKCWYDSDGGPCHEECDRCGGRFDCVNANGLCDECLIEITEEDIFMMIHVWNVDRYGWLSTVTDDSDKGKEIFRSSFCNTAGDAFGAADTFLKENG